MTESDRGINKTSSISIPVLFETVVERMKSTSDLSISPRLLSLTRTIGEESSDIVTDGIVHVGQRDPPGQSSVYIPSGDTWKETYRLSTFSQFFNSAVLPNELAASGFYYTGFKDRVKCFSCGLTVENWIQGDNPTDKRWHQSNCDFANDRETQNEPSASGFTKWRIKLLQKAGNRNAIGSHVSSNVVNVNCQSNEARMLQQSRYPNYEPLNSHMASAVKRSETFKPKNGRRWPEERLRASIDELVKAGFFFLGERDRVKCFYCNGGLQNWEYDDDPWIEHVKWFPSCNYALREKGPEFVKNIVNQFPDLDRPTPARPRPRSENRGGDIPPVLSTVEAIEQAMSSTPHVRLALEMGFNAERIKAVLKRKYDTNKRFFSSSEEFMEALLHQTNINESSRQHITENHLQESKAPISAGCEIPPSAFPNSIVSVSSSSACKTSSIRTVASELQNLEDARSCKACRKKISDIFFLPCGHLASCEPCAKVLKKCPICKRSIQEKIKTFRS